MAALTDAPRIAYINITGNERVLVYDGKELARSHAREDHPEDKEISRDVDAMADELFRQRISVLTNYISIERPVNSGFSDPMMKKFAHREDDKTHRVVDAVADAPAETDPFCGITDDPMFSKYR